MSTPEQRDQIFRDRLVVLTEELNSGANKDKTLRRTVGLLAVRMAKDAGARNWADLKDRADGPTYDSMLRLFQRQSETAQKAGDGETVRAMEVLAISLIARRQYQAELVPGVTFLDKFIENCATRARRAGAQFISSQRART